MAVGFSIPAVPAVVLGTTATVCYQVPNTAGFWYETKNIVLANTTTAVVTVTMYRAPTAGTVTDATAWLKDFTLGAKQSLFISDVFTLSQNESIRGLCSAAASVTVTISGFGKVT